MSRNLLPLSLTAVLLAGTALAEAPRVAVDIAPVHSLVAQVMTGVGTPALIVPAGASPHSYALRPSEAQALQDADLVFWIGAELTPWMEGAIDTVAAGARVTTLLDADGITLLEFREGALFDAHDHGDDHGDNHAEADHDHGDDHSDDHAGADHDHGDDHAEADHGHGDDHGDDHSDDHAEADHDHGDDHAEADHGHDHGTHDPHAWLSPDNAAVWLNVIAADLSAADPDNAGAYFANAAAARAELAALSEEVTATLAPLRGMRFVVFHDAYRYFETAFDFPASGAISLSDAVDPGPARIAEIQARVAAEGIDCVLSEPQYDPGIVATVMDGTQARTAVLDPLGSDLEPGPDLYPQLIRNLATSLAACL